DNSAAMLAHAKRKVPECTFYLADMTDFHLGQKFDTIYCVHNSINHLLSFAEWKALFDRAHAQLKPNGLFIFDLNTEERLELLAKRGIGVWPADNDYVLVKVGKHPERKRHYNWEVRIFIQKDPYSFTYHPLAIEVSTYPLEKILGALGRRFSLADIVEIRETNDPADYGRMYIICRRA